MKYVIITVLAIWLVYEIVQIARAIVRKVRAKKARENAHEDTGKGEEVTND